MIDNNNNDHDIINKIEKVRDFNTLGRSFITALNGILAITLTSIAGTIDVDDVESNKTLRNLSISFGAVISGLQILLLFGVDTMIVNYTKGPEQENILREMLYAKTPNEKIQKSNELIGRLIVEIKKTRNEMSSIEDRITLGKQISDLETAYAPLGTGLE